jgi:hypothetical protein
LASAILLIGASHGGIRFDSTCNDEEPENANGLATVVAGD